MATRKQPAASAIAVRVPTQRTNQPPMRLPATSPPQTTIAASAATRPRNRCGIRCDSSPPSTGDTDAIARPATAQVAQPRTDDLVGRLRGGQGGELHGG